MKREAVGTEIFNFDEICNVCKVNNMVNINGMCVDCDTFMKNGYVLEKLYEKLNSMINKKGVKIVQEIVDLEIQQEQFCNR